MYTTKTNFIINIPITQSFVLKIMFLYHPIKANGCTSIKILGIVVHAIIYLYFHPDCA